MLTIQAYTYPIVPITLRKWVYFFLIFSLMIKFSYYAVYHDCPNQSFYSTSFNSSSAKIHLDNVLKYGEKTAGSLSLNKFTTKYIIDQVKLIIDKKSPKILMDYELSKSLPSSYQIMGHITSYDKLYNIILTIKATGSSKNASYLLVNCHYDTPPGSHGASDDFISCAIMLEVARILSTGEYQLKHNLLLLFNGAEEALLPASHAFITQHPLRDKIMTFINLEGAGAGGRSILFQSTPSRISNFLIDSYSRTSWSVQANVFAEELFQSGLIPGETDFRIFTHFGNIPGVDFAHIDEGYAYHTVHDVPNRISEKCFKLCGDNMLLMITDLLNTEGIERIPRLANSSHEERLSNKILASPEKFFSGFLSKLFYPKDLMHYFYFDVFTLYIVRAPLLYLLIFNILLSALCISHLIRKRIHLQTRQRNLYTPTLSGLWRIMLMQTCLLIGSLIFALILAHFHVKIGLTLCWFTWKCNLIFIYIIPMIAFQLAVHWLFIKLTFHSPPTKFNWFMDKKPDLLNYTNIFQDTNDSSLLLLVTVMMIFTLFRLASSHVFTQWILFVHIIPQAFISLFKHRQTSLLLRLIIGIIPFAATDYIMHISLLFKVFIPVAGRSGQTLPGDYPIAIIFFIVMFPFILSLSPSFTCTQPACLKKMFSICLGVYAVSLVMLKTTHYGFPYASIGDVQSILNGTSPTSQQRLFLIHMDKVLHEDWENPNLITDKTSCLSLTTLDGNGFRYLNASSSPLEAPEKVDFPVGSLQLYKCNFSQPYCGISYHYPFAFAFSHNYRYTLGVNEHRSEPVASLKILNKEVIIHPQDHKKYVNVTISVTGGPPHTHMYLRSDGQCVNITRFSHVDNHVKPMELPSTNDDPNDNHRGEHFFIFHLNNEAVVDENGESSNSTNSITSPWISWIVFEMYNKSINLTNTFEHTFDLALSAHYFDMDLPKSGRSPEIERLVETHLPDWFVITSYPTLYEMWKVSLL